MVLSDLLSDLVIHVKCLNNVAQQRNTYLKCNRLKFTLNRSHSAPPTNRKRFNSPWSRAVHASRSGNRVFGKYAMPPPPYPWQKLPTSRVEVFVILLNNATPRRGTRRRPAEHGWSRVRLMEGNRPVFLSDRTGGGVKSTFVLPADTFHRIRKTSLLLTYSRIHNLQVADN